jgi:hypothetical protein
MGLAAASDEFSHIFTPPPSVDWAALVIGDDLKNFERMIDRFENDQTVWRTETAAKMRTGLQKLSAAAADLPRNSAKEIYAAGLAPAIEALNETIKSYSVPLHEQQPAVSGLVETLGSLAPGSSKFLRKQLRGIEQLRVVQHNACVDWYYGLLAFLSEFEDEAERGPSFSDPDELERFLRQSLG